jgi:FOG: CheY-like receiver
MSAYSQDEAAQDCLKAGMNDYISKPIDPVNFIQCLINIFLLIASIYY